MNLTDGFWGSWEGKKNFGFVAETACYWYQSSFKLSFAFKKEHILCKSVSEINLEFHLRLMMK